MTTLKTLHIDQDDIDAIVQELSDLHDSVQDDEAWRNNLDRLCGVLQQESDGDQPPASGKAASEHALPPPGDDHLVCLSQTDRDTLCRLLAQAGEATPTLKADLARLSETLSTPFKPTVVVADNKSGISSIYDAQRVTVLHCELIHADNAVNVDSPLEDVLVDDEGDLYWKLDAIKGIPLSQRPACLQTLRTPTLQELEFYFGDLSETV